MVYKVVWPLDDNKIHSIKGFTVKKTLQKAENFSSHVSEYAGIVPTDLDKSYATIQFISHQKNPSISEEKEDGESISFELSPKDELIHECSISMPISGVKRLQTVLENYLKNYKDQD